jgi:hypothetical protein
VTGNTSADQGGGVIGFAGSTVNITFRRCRTTRPPFPGAVLRSSGRS